MNYGLHIAEQVVRYNYKIIHDCTLRTNNVVMETSGCEVVGVVLLSIS